MRWWTISFILILIPLVNASECDDGLDNDADGLIDWQYDLGCFGQTDNTEGGKNFALENGWTVIEPSSDTLIIYVSSSEGNDSWDGKSGVWNGTSGPKKTISGAWIVFCNPDKSGKCQRNNKPDWLLLRRGDIWYDENLGNGKNGYWLKDGKDEDELTWVASYGESTKRPVIVNGGWENNQGWQDDLAQSNNFQRNYIGIKGISFYREDKDPNSPNFTASQDGIISRAAPGKIFYLEDLHLKYGGINFFVGGAYLYNVTLRRSIVDGSYSTTKGHTQGFFGGGLKGITLEENVFDHNGWNEEFEYYITPNMSIPWNTINDGRFSLWINGTTINFDNLNFQGVDDLQEISVVLQQAINQKVGVGKVMLEARKGPIIFKAQYGAHPRVIDVKKLGPYNGTISGTDIEGNDYLGPGESPDATQFNHNIYLPSESYVSGQNGGVILRKNILSRGSGSSVQLRPGGDADNNLMIYNVAGHYGKTSSTPVPGGVNGSFTNNVLLHGTFTSGTDSRGYEGFGFGHINNLIVENNPVAHVDGGSSSGTGFGFGDPHEGIKNLVVKKNIIYNHGIGLNFCCGAGDFNYSKKTISFENNILERNDNGVNNEIIVMKLFEGFEEYSKYFLFTNNTYYTPFNINKWYSVGGYDSEMSIEEWKNKTGEKEAKGRKSNFSDPNRNITTYLTDLGLKPDYDLFIQQAGNNSQYDWDERFTAEVVNEYIREGFGMNLSTSNYATCYDGISNGGETGIDCGGICRMCYTNITNVTQEINCSINNSSNGGGGGSSGSEGNEVETSKINKTSLDNEVGNSQNRLDNVFLGEIMPEDSKIKENSSSFTYKLGFFILITSILLLVSVAIYYNYKINNERREEFERQNKESRERVLIYQREIGSSQKI